MCGQLVWIILDMSDVIKVLMITGNSEILHEIITFLKENSQYQSMNLSMPSNTLTASASGIHTVRGIGYKVDISLPASCLKFLIIFREYPVPLLFHLYFLKYIYY